MPIRLWPTEPISSLLPRTRKNPMVWAGWGTWAGSYWLCTDKNAFRAWNPDPFHCAAGLWYASHHVREDSPLSVGLIHMIHTMFLKVITWNCSSNRNQRVWQPGAPKSQWLHTFLLSGAGGFMDAACTAGNCCKAYWGFCGERTDQSAGTRASGKLWLR